MSESNKGTIALVLGIVGVVCCPICGPFAWYLGKAELNAINAGQAAESGRGLATAGVVLGIIGTIFFVLSLLWMFLWGGMAVVHGVFG